ncbi:DUF1304 domain-containing protein [Arthrobacter psychrolactophilus]
MFIAALIFAGLAALVHVYIFVLESLRWTADSTRKTFGTSVADANATKEMAFNQGFYNLFLAVVAVAGITAGAAGHHGVGAALRPRRGGFHARGRAGPADFLTLESQSGPRAAYLPAARRRPCFGVAGSLENSPAQATRYER